MHPKLTTCFLAPLVLIQSSLAYPQTQAPQRVVFKDPTELIVPSTLSAREQIKRHIDIYEKLIQALDQAEKDKEEARNKDSAKLMEAAYLDERTALHYMLPYLIAEEKGQELIKQGYKAKEPPDDKTQVEICNDNGQCAEIDPIVGLFLLIADAVFGEFKKDKPFGPNNEIVKFLKKPLGERNSELVKMRDFLIFHDKNGEIARLIRDPIKRPIEIVQNVRDKIIPKNDRGEIAKTIRDPGKCTVGRLFGKCR